MEYTNRYSTTHTEFGKQLSKGKKGERLVAGFLKNRGWEVVDVSKSINYQRQDVDFRIFRDKKPGLSVEVKHDKNIGSTGNVGLVTYNSWNTSRDGDGWFNFSTADLLMVVDADSGEIYAFNLPQLRDYVASNKLEAKKYELYDGTVIKMVLVDVATYAADKTHYFQKFDNKGVEM